MARMRKTDIDEIASDVAASPLATIVSLFLFYR